MPARDNLYKEIIFSHLDQINYWAGCFVPRQYVDDRDYLHAEGAKFHLPLQIQELNLRELRKLY